jgi:hypothetical protein
VSYQATVAADNAVREMQRLQDDVKRQRAETEKKFAEVLKQNKEASQKAISDGQAKREGKSGPLPAQEVPEHGYTFFDSEDEYNPPPAPSFQMPEIPPPPRPTPRRTARRVFEDDDDDYSNQSWME